MSTLDKHDVRRILSYLDDIKELTDLLRRAHFNVPTDAVYGAVGGEAAIRSILLDVSLDSIAVEPVGEA